MHFSHLVKVRKNSHSLSLQAFLTHSHSLSLSLAGLYHDTTLPNFIVLRQPTPDISVTKHLADEQRNKET